MRRVSFVRFSAVFGLLFLSLSTVGGAREPAKATAAQALEQLQSGNARFVAGKSDHPHADPLRRIDTALHGQRPTVSVLTCSDSRVPPEAVFDQGLGDLFVVRVAGNVANVDEIGSLEYGVEHLGTPLLVVLGHSQCGAVTAVATGAKAEGNIPRLLEGIGPAVEKAAKSHPTLHGKELVPAAIEANVWQSIEDLFERSEMLRTMAKHGEVKVIGAEYDVESGRVRILGEHPEQGKLLGAAAASH